MNVKILSDWEVLPFVPHNICRTNEYGIVVEIGTVYNSPPPIAGPRQLYFVFFHPYTIRKIIKDHPAFGDKLFSISNRENFCTIEEAKLYVDAKLKSIGCRLISNQTKMML